MHELYKKHKLHWYTNPSPHKTSICERFIQTLKRKLVKYVTHFNREDVTSVIYKLVLAYNLRSHAGLANEAPIDIHLLNDWEKIKSFSSNLYKRRNCKIKTVTSPHPLETVVRLKHASRVFGQRSIHILNTVELFRIIKINDTHPITYRVAALDSVDDPIEGSFYHQELIPVEDSGFYPIRILKTRKNKHNKTEYLVDYFQYPGSKPRWVTRNMLQKI